MEPLLWFRFVDRNRHRWRIYLAVERQVPDLSDCSGICYADAKLIFVNAAEPCRIELEVVFHEIMHAGFEASGRKTSARFEELVIDAVDTDVARLAKQLGAKLPRRPRGWKALREYQRARVE